jgi:uncharacterized membrane protein
VSAANQAFIDAMNTGFLISAAVLATAIVIAFTLIPRHMRTEQAEQEPVVGDFAATISESAVD